MLIWNKTVMSHTNQDLELYKSKCDEILMEMQGNHGMLTHFYIVIIRFKPSG